MPKKIKNLSGFSYIEAIISIFLLSCGIVAVLALITSTYRDSRDSRDQQIATFLAQEGVELVRNIRDNNWAQGAESFENLPQIEEELICRIDVTMDNLQDQCNDDLEDDKRLYLDDNGIYVHDDGTPTKFRRLINFYPMVDENIGAASAVTWGEDFEEIVNCTPANKCVVSRATFEKWGE